VAVALAGPYASLHLAPDSVKALKIVIDYYYYYYNYSSSSSSSCDRLLVQNFHMAICTPMPATVIIGFQPVFSEQLQAEERSLPLSQ